MRVRSDAPSPGSGVWGSHQALGPWGAGLCAQLCNKLSSLQTLETAGYVKSVLVSNSHIHPSVPAHLSLEPLLLVAPSSPDRAAVPTQATCPKALPIC